MTSDTIRKQFIDFFTRRGHKNLPASPLIPENDPTVLFTSAGMQQFKKFYLDPTLAKEKKVVTIQPCIRTSDIEEVGDDTHLTMLEMLGNFSFDGYFKFDAIHLAWEFITEVLKIDPKRIEVTVFRGDKLTPLDYESIKIWQDMGVSPKKIRMGAREDNFWGPTGEEGPCGPTTEIYIDGIEIWNLVFNQYFKDRTGKFLELEKPGVDTGMGLERLVAVMQNKKNIYQTDLFLPIIHLIKKLGRLKRSNDLSDPNERSDRTARTSERIIADHGRAIAFLLSEEILPSNKEQGYVVRRLLRRMIIHAKLLGIESITSQILPLIISLFKDRYYNLTDKEERILEIALSEEEKFGKTLNLGLKHFNKLLKNNQKTISGKDAFMLYDSYGFPIELTEELAHKNKLKVSRKAFEDELRAQKERSRTATKGFFKGGLASGSEQETKLHTATHLLHAALRKIIGPHVQQMGSNINAERLRFDFSHREKLTSEQIKKIEDLVNEQIKKSLPITLTEMATTQARDSGALGFFAHKYGAKVKVYSIGLKRPFSVEICGGPHVKNTRELGHFKIIKEESSSSGVRRIKAIL